MNLHKRILSLIFVAILALPGTALAKSNSKKDQKISLEPVSISDEYNREVFGSHFAEPSFVDCEEIDFFYEYAYTDDQGNIVSWFPAKKETLDGLHWTAEKREIEEYNPSKYEDHIKEAHAHLYMSLRSHMVYPIYCEEAYPIIDDVKYMKLPEVRFLEAKKCKELLNSGLIRVIDNLDLLDVYKSGINETFKTFLFIEPIYVNEKSIVCSFVYADASTLSYNEHRNELLLSCLVLISNGCKSTLQNDYPAVSIEILDTTQLQDAYPSFMLTKK